MTEFKGLDVIATSSETIERLMKSNEMLHSLIKNDCIKGVGTIQTVKEIIYANEEIIDKALN